MWLKTATVSLPLQRSKSEHTQSWFCFFPSQLEAMFVQPLKNYVEDSNPLMGDAPDTVDKNSSTISLSLSLGWTDNYHEWN